MTREQAKDILIEEITYMGVCKATELPTRFFGRESECELFEHSIPDLLEELTNEERVLTIEYSLPDMPHRVKSLYLPTGAKIERIVGQN